MPLSGLALRGTGKSGRSIGRREPSYTGTSAPMASKTRNEFSVHSSTGTLPFTVVAATSSRSGCNAANMRATASSVPVSTSRMSFVGTGGVPPSLYSPWRVGHSTQVNDNSAKYRLRPRRRSGTASVDHRRWPVTEHRIPPHVADVHVTVRGHCHPDWLRELVAISLRDARRDLA